MANSPFARQHRHHLPSWAAPVIMLVFLLVLLTLSRVVRADETPQDVPSSYEMAAENDLFQLYVDSTTLAFKLRDKRSGYLWHSGLDAVIDGDRLNKSWQAFALSGLSIEYLDARAVNKRVSISNTTHTLDVTPIEQGVAAQVSFDDYGISVGLHLQLEAEGVRVEVPFASIQETNPDFRLGRVYVYPFLGATRGSTIPGYMLLPDGVGSMIPFADFTRATNMFYGRYYGSDQGTATPQNYNALVSATYPISAPIFGVVHNDQNAFLSVVEKGASYGDLEVHPAGIITNFNFLYSSFLYNEPYFQATNRSGAGVTTVQKQPNIFDAIIHYRFLTGREANYVGLAHSYQTYLIDHGLLHKQDDPNPNMGIRLEFLGGDKKKDLAWYSFVSMTTIQQMSAILSDLDLPNPEVIYYGWQPYGATTMPPATLTLESSLGSVGELNALAQSLTEKGGHFSLYLDPQGALWGEPGYSVLNDLAMTITRGDVQGYSRFPVYYFTLPVLQQRYETLSRDIAAQFGGGLALDSIGSTVYSDFRPGQTLTREEAIAAYQSLLAQSPLPIGFYRPNAYLFGMARAYYDMPLGSNGYIYTSGAVPFLPIVLAGYVPYYGTALNFSSNPQDDLLHHVEFGIYPSYFLTHEATGTMLYTPSNWIYTSSYAQWGETIRQTYHWMNALLAPVRGQTIVAHGPLAEGVFATTYSSGQQIIVNYTDRPFVYEGHTIAAKDAALVEKTP